MTTPERSADRQDWFAEQVYSYESLIKSWLSCRFPGLKAEVDDIVQEAFVKTINANAKRPISDTKIFLFKVSKNLAIDYLRKKRVVDFKSLVENEISLSIENNRDVMQEVTRKQDFEILSEAIDSLPKKCRQIITLRKLYGLSHKEISRKMSLSRNTIEVQLNIGIGKLREYFKAHSDGVN